MKSAVEKAVGRKMSMPRDFDFLAMCIQDVTRTHISSLYATSLCPDNQVKLLWSPDRCVVVRYMGEDLFEVVESLNSKLQVGDRFCCGCFIEGEPLYLTRLVRKDQALGAYVCGQADGVKYVVENIAGKALCDK